MKSAVFFALLGLVSTPVFAAAEPVAGPVLRAPVRQMPRMQLPVVQPPEGSMALRCRGGPVKNIGFSQAPAGGYGVFNAHFTKSDKPADQGLEPAQCSWLDRGMSADEGAVVCRELNDLVFSMAHVGDPDYTPKDIWILSFVHSKSNPWVEKLRNPDEYFTFYVKNEGCMRIVG